VIFRSLARFMGAEDDSGDRSPGGDFWFQGLAGPMTSSGVRVSAESAMRSTAVFACVRVIAETIGSLPAILYRRLERGKERAVDHPLYSLLRYRPNPRQTALEFYEMVTGHCALRGNAYAERVYDGSGRLTALVPLHPDRVQVDVLPTGGMRYLYTDAGGQQFRYDEQDMFHLRGLSSDGHLGLSVIGHAANSIGMALAAEHYGARFFANDATPGGVLTSPGHFKDKEVRQAFADHWQRAQAGRNRGRTAVLEDGMKYESVGVTNTDAQFLESRKFQVADIARVFRVPLVLIGETEKSTSWGTGIEQFMQAFVTHTIRPWCVRWEQALQRDFLTDEERTEDEHFMEFLVEALLRGDTKSRYDAYNSAIDHKWMLPNEARERENMNPVPWGDEPYEAPNTAKAPGKVGDGKPQPAREDDDGEEAAARQVVRKEVVSIGKAYTALLGRRAAFEAWARRFYGTHAAYVAQKLGCSREFARRYCDSQLDELLQAVAVECGERAEGELPAATVPTHLEVWESDRASELVQKLKG
jgi:HK97 family phage portal protein